MTKKKPAHELRTVDAMKRLFPTEVNQHIREIAKGKTKK